MRSNLIVMLSDKQTVQIKSLGDGNKEVKFLATDKVYLLTGDVTIKRLEELSKEAGNVPA